MKLRVGLAFLAALLLSGPGLAETSTDRTEPIEIQVEGPEQVLHPQEDKRILVRPHDLEEDHQQIDVLFNWEGKRERGGIDQSNFPILYRIDSGPDTEFRVGWGGYTWQGRQAGFKDLSLGLKWNFAEGPSSWALLGVVELPTGSNGFGDREIEPGLVLSHEHRLSERWSVTWNAGLQSMVDSGSRDRYFQGSYAGQVAYSPGPRHHVSLSCTGYGPDQDPGGIHRLAAHLGYTFSPAPRQQYLLVLTRGFSPRGVDWGVTTGFSRRF